MAATLVLAMAGVIGYGLNQRVEALPTQLALDHAKCFALGEPLPESTTPALVETSLREKYGWQITVPEGSAGEDLVLLGARRCLSSEGQVAHVMYRHRGRPLSLFVLPGVSRDRRSFDIMGYETILWSGTRAAYAVVGETQPDEMRRVASYCENRVR